MKFKTLMIMTAIMIASLTTSSIASQSSNPPQVTAQSQAEPTARQILEVCVQNQAETLPNPFIDVPTSHWAFKAVVTMHYCGAYRQATSPNLIEQPTNQAQPTKPALPIQ